MKQALTKKAGPLPRWAWGAIILGGILILYLRARSNAATAAAQQTQDPSAQYNSSDPTQYPTDAYGGSYPLGGGLGSGFDPTSFTAGIQYGQGFGNGTSTAPGNGTTQQPPAQGSSPSVVIIQNGQPKATSTGAGGSKGTTSKMVMTSIAGKQQKVSETPKKIANTHVATGNGTKGRTPNDRVNPTPPKKGVKTTKWR